MLARTSDPVVCCRLSSAALGALHHNRRQALSCMLPEVFEALLVRFQVVVLKLILHCRGVRNPHGIGTGD